MAGNLSAEGDFLAAELEDHRTEGELAVTADPGAAGDAETEQLDAQGFVGDGGYGGLLAAAKFDEGHASLLWVVVKLKSVFKIKKAADLVK